MASSSEYLKRRREEHQLAMQQQCDDERRHRYSRVDGRPLKVSCGHPYAADDNAPKDAERTSTGSYARLPSPALSSSSVRRGDGSRITTRTERPLSPYAASGYLVGAPAAFPFTKSLSLLLPSCQSAQSCNDGIEMTLTLRSILVSVVRGDSGRRCSFLIRPTFAYTWRRSRMLYESFDGKQAGLEVQETVRCRVRSFAAARRNSATLRPTTATSRTAYFTFGSLKALDSATTASPCGGSPTLLSHNEESPSTTVTPDFDDNVFADGYSYEATQISRCYSIPTCSAGLGESASSLGSCSPALFADCLIKCAQDETAVALDDRHGWVHLYRGRHIATEMGRTRLLKDLFALGYFGPTSADGASPCGEPPSLTICVFRKC
ncbi:hypothetical protein CUR178_00909 [Leishmania enriettii]|uniref:Uncharacterized protein n=1 Tax=Leishmania enriettii TaxID=5663 RepID=A0A836GNW3_LEIEN|nr:hypothetical protein CUR178_00909 [Leishmania enriettii]